MDRRTFIKVLLVTLPALYLDPAACLGFEHGNAYAVEQPDTDLSIFFIGDYGRRILQAYRKREVRNAGPVPISENIGLDISEKGEIILTREGPVIHRAVPKRNRSKLGIFVLDARDEEDLSLAEDLCRQISREPKARTICLTPEWLAESLIRAPFNFVLVTKSKAEDLAVHVLLTLNNTFLGYDTAGEYQQLTHLLDMMSLWSSRYLMQAGVGRITERQDPETDAQRLFEQAYRHVGQPTRETKIFGILEANEDDELIIDVFSGAYAVARQRLQAGYAPMAIIFHEDLTYPKAQMTLFRVVGRCSLGDRQMEYGEQINRRHCPFGGRPRNRTENREVMALIDTWSYARAVWTSSNCSRVVLIAVPTPRYSGPELREHYIVGFSGKRAFGCY